MEGERSTDEQYTWEEVPRSLFAFVSGLFSRTRCNVNIIIVILFDA